MVTMASRAAPVSSRTVPEMLAVGLTAVAASTADCPWAKYSSMMRGKNSVSCIRLGRIVSSIPHWRDSLLLTPLQDRFVDFTTPFWVLDKLVEQGRHTHIVKPGKLGGNGGHPGSS